MPDKPVQITTGDFTVSGDTVTLKNAELHALASNNEATALTLLSKVAPIDLNDVTVHPDGTVVIADAAFAKNLTQAAAANRGALRAAEAGNGICGVGCADAASPLLRRVNDRSLRSLITQVDRQ